MKPQKEKERMSICWFRVQQLLQMKVLNKVRIVGQVIRLDEDIR